MALVSLVLELDSKDADRLSDALLEAGALSVSAEDPFAGTPAEVPIYDEPGCNDGGQPDQWPRLRLRVLIDDGGNAQSMAPEIMLAAAASAAGLTTLPGHLLEPVDDDDWVRKTQAQFQPINISGRLWIVPSWHEAPDPSAINIALDPGIAFGTGSHPTTKLCLRWLESRVRGGETVLDYGCGSGILAIAAAKMGASRIVGVDIDPAAVESARDNAFRNNVTAKFIDAGNTLEMKADLVVANILANPLKMLAPLLASHVRTGGRIALAGVLSAQAAEVEGIYSPWFDFEPGVEEEGWVCLSGQRKPGQ